jgi:hypothetical protein
MANNLDICVENTDKIEKHIRLTMETVDTDTNRLSYSARSIGLGHVNRQELIDKIETLKNKWTAGIQFA